MIIAEVAQAHEGSLGMAHAYIDAVADAGADGVKFQTHIASAESTRSEPWRVKFSPQDASRYDYWKRMEFDEGSWIGLRQHAEERALAFLSSPFSLEAVELLNRVGVSAWKIPSGEVTNLPMLGRILQSRLPVFLSSGMSSLAELDRAVEFVAKADVPIVVLQCTSAYPCPPEKIGLNLLEDFGERYRCAVGLSDHSGTIFPGLAAATMGAAVVEVHVTMSRRMFGPDVSASITVEELETLVNGVRFIEVMNANPVDKDGMSGELQPLRQLFMKSVVARLDLAEGTVLREEHLAAKKPGNGIPINRIPDVVGRRLKRRVSADQLLAEDDLEVSD
jgi:N-acetylneuraminate synthase